MTEVDRRTRRHGPEAEVGHMCSDDTQTGRKPTNSRVLSKPERQGMGSSLDSPEGTSPDETLILSLLTSRTVSE